MSGFTFDSAQIRGGSYIDSPDWITKKKATEKSEKYGQ